MSDGIDQRRPLFKHFDAISKMSERSRAWRHDIENKEWTDVIDLMEALEDFLLWRPIVHWAPQPMTTGGGGTGTSDVNEKKMIPASNEGQNRPHNVKSAAHITVDQWERCKWDDRGITRHALGTLEQMGVAKLKSKQKTSHSVS